MEEKREERVDVKSCVLKSVLGAAIALGAVLVIFGGLAHHWVIGWMAGACCAIGTALCVFMRSYFKAMEQWYKAHPQPRADGEESSRDSAEDESKK